MGVDLARTTKEDQKIAQSSFSQLNETSRKIARTRRGAVDIKIQKGSHGYLRIPKRALLLLADILKNMAEGRSITLIPSDSKLSTQQAADMLNVSRPHLVKLLEKGEIPYEKVGSHRRVELKNIVAYQQTLKKIRNESLDELARQAQDLNLGY